MATTGLACRSVTPVRRFIWAARARSTMCATAAATAAARARVFARRLAMTRRPGCSANMLQLAWSINRWLHGPDDFRPNVTFQGPPTNAWYGTDQTVTFTIRGGTMGIAGYTARWDNDPGDPIDFEAWAPATHTGMDRVFRSAPTGR